MQKVEGSNPFSRFFTCKSALSITTMNLSDGAFSITFWARDARTKVAFFAVFGHWCPKRGD
jgi:hypothetical protein